MASNVWVRTNDRLPEESIPVLVQYIDKRASATYLYCIAQYVGFTGKWVPYKCYMPHDLTNVSYWCYFDEL